VFEIAGFLRQSSFTVKLIDCYFIARIYVLICYLFLYFQGAQFWKTARKVYVCKKAEVNNLKQQSKKRGGRGSDVIEELRRMIGEPSINQSLESDDPSTVSASNTIPLAKETIAEIMRCTICLSTAHFPAASCSVCYGFIGCIPCTEQWISSTLSRSKCPLCRNDPRYHISSWTDRAHCCTTE